MNIDVHCPECGAITRKERDSEENTGIVTDLLICTNDNCPRIIVAVQSVSFTHEVTVTPFGEKTS